MRGRWKQFEGLPSKSFRQVFNWDFFVWRDAFSPFDGLAPYLLCFFAGNLLMKKNILSVFWEIGANRLDLFSFINRAVVLYLPIL